MIISTIYSNKQYKNNSIFFTLRPIIDRHLLYRGERKESSVFRRSKFPTSTQTRNHIKLNKYIYHINLVK